MLLDWQKETTPVLYGGNAVKALDMRIENAGETAFSMHWHERMELLLVTEGEAAVSFGDEEFSASAGNLVIIPPGQPHCGVAVRVPLKYYAIMFDISPFGGDIPSVAVFMEQLKNKSIGFERLTDRPEIIASADESVCFVPSVLRAQISDSER